MKKYAIALCALAAGGCAGTVETTRIDHRYSSDRAITGVSYALPMLQYEIEVSHTLTGCVPAVDKNGVLKSDTLTFDTKVKPKARYIPGERFHIDYRKLSGLFRTSTFTIENYDNGTIKSIGVSAEDKTGDALKSAAKLAGGVVALTAGAPPVGLAPADQPNDTQKAGFAKKALFFVCTSAAGQHLTSMNGLKKLVKTATDDLADANAEVERLSKRFALKVVEDGDAAKWDAAVIAQLKTKKELEDQNKKLDEVKAKLTASYTIKWPEKKFTETGTFAITDKLVVDGKLTAQWKDMFRVEQIAYKTKKPGVDFATKCQVAKAPTSTDLGANTELHACLAEKLDMQFDFQRDWPIEALRPEDKIKKAKDDKKLTQIDQQSFVVGDNQSYEGFFYREAAQGGLMICLKRYWEQNKCSKSPLAKPEFVNFPQLGQLGFIPFKVLAFQGKDQTLSFSAEGRPTKIELKSTKAAGSAAIAAAADATSTIVEALEKREEERRSDAKAAREAKVADLTTEIDLLEKQAKIDQLTAEPATPSEDTVRLTEMKADIELKRAELLQRLLTEGLESGTVDPVILFGADE